MALLDALLTLGQGNAPPVAVPDARAEVAIWCSPTCAPEAVDALRAELGRLFTVRPLLPSRPVTAPRALVKTVDADTFGRWTGEALDLAGGTLGAEDRARLDGSAEVVVVSTACPTGGLALACLRTLNQAALGLAQSQGGLVEDISTREVYSLAAWEALRVKALAEEVLLAEQFTILWSAEGDRATTLGLRKLGLHELSLGGINPELADDALATLTLLAAWDLDGKPLNRHTLVGVDSLTPSPTRDWLLAWRIDPGEQGEGHVGEDPVNVSLRNRRPGPAEPPGPILEVGVEGRYGDPEATARLMDRLWGWTTLGP